MYRIRTLEHRPVIISDAILAEYGENKVETLHVKVRAPSASSANAARISDCPTPPAELALARRGPIPHHRHPQALPAVQDQVYPLRQGKDDRPRRVEGPHVAASSLDQLDRPQLGRALADRPDVRFLLLLDAIRHSCRCVAAKGCETTVCPSNAH